MSSAWLSVLANISVFGISSRPGNISGQLVAEGADDGADLVGVDDIAVEILGTIGEVLVLDLPALAARQDARASRLAWRALSWPPCFVLFVSMT